MSSIWKVGQSRGKSQTLDADMPGKDVVPSGIIVAGDFKIDLESRSATVRGHQVRLSTAEFNVLVYLTSHRKRVVTSQTLRRAIKKRTRNATPAAQKAAMMSVAVISNSAHLD
jgi:DNA-binding response OmpR family regulator